MPSGNFRMNRQSPVRTSTFNMTLENKPKNAFKSPGTQSFGRKVDSETEFTAPLLLLSVEMKVRPCNKLNHRVLDITERAVDIATNQFDSIFGIVGNDGPQNMTVFSTRTLDPCALLKINLTKSEKPLIDGIQVLDDQNISMRIGERDVELLIQGRQFAHGTLRQRLGVLPNGLQAKQNLFFETLVRQRANDLYLQRETEFVKILDIAQLQLPHTKAATRQALKQALCRQIRERLPDRTPAHAELLRQHFLNQLKLRRVLPGDNAFAQGFDQLARGIGFDVSIFHGKPNVLFEYCPDLPKRKTCRLSIQGKYTAMYTILVNNWLPILTIADTNKAMDHEQRLRITSNHMI